MTNGTQHGNSKNYPLPMSFARLSTLEINNVKNKQCFGKLFNFLKIDIISNGSFRNPRVKADTILWNKGE